MENITGIKPLQKAYEAEITEKFDRSDIKSKMNFPTQQDSVYSIEII